MSTVTNHVGCTNPWYDVIKMALDLGGLPPNVIMRKTSNKFPCTKRLPRTPQNWQGHQKEKTSVLASAAHILTLE